MNGDQASKILREKGYSRFIIGVTGDAMLEEIDRFRSSGVDDIIVKPMSSAAFVRSTENLERKKEELQSMYDI